LGPTPTQTPTPTPIYKNYKKILLYLIIKIINF